MIPLCNRCVVCNPATGPAHSYETEDGTSADMSGQNKLIGDQQGIEMRGSYTYISPEGKTVTVR